MNSNMIRDLFDKVRELEEARDSHEEFIRYFTCRHPNTKEMQFPQGQVSGMNVAIELIREVLSKYF